MSEVTNTTELSLNILEEAEIKSFISFDVDTPQSKIMAYNAINNPDGRIADMINQEIYIKDVVMLPVQLINEDTGAEEDAVRSIIIDADGTTYTATATGIYNSLKNIYVIYKTLHFEEPLRVKVLQVSTKKGNTLTLKILA